MATNSQIIPSSILDTVSQSEALSYGDLLPDDSVDLVMTDLPYGTTRNKWDSVIDPELFWKMCDRVLSPDGVVAMTTAQPFTSTMVVSNIKNFKVEWIWSKTIGSGQLNIKHQPLRTHESVLVFYRKPGTYNPQMTEGEAYVMTRKAAGSESGYGGQRDVEVVNDGVRHPKTVLRFPNPRISGGHPTQKPVPLFEYFIRTYSNPGDVVFDPCMGAGTTAVASILNDRHFVGCELDKGYMGKIRKNISSAYERKGK
jgi:site-specific DNA-methyltransferase (adenine-specific)